jgi:CheY-like chemotaxis protein
MSEDKRKVMVIDDDEVVLVAITDLLEEVGCQVFTQTSPIGATQVIVREGINAAVIDVNLPVMQGDNVIRLFRSWDKVKDLPIVVVSGAGTDKLAAIQRELPGVKIVRKDEMAQRLAPAVLEALARAGRTAKPSARGSDAQRRPNELLQRVGQDLSQHMTLAREVWKEAREGHLERIGPLNDALARVGGQAQLLGLERVALLTQALVEVFVAVKHGRRLAQGVDRTVEHAMGALAGLKSSPECEFSFSPVALARSLKQSVLERRVG